MDEEDPKPEPCRRVVPPTLRPPTAVVAAVPFPGQPPHVSTLRELLAASGTLAIEDAVTIAIAIASDLDAHHRKGLVHGDIKPANVFLPGGKPQVRWPEINQDRNRSDEVGCTPVYASPEQMEGRQFDLRTDVYSLGVVVHEMLVGEPPFTSNDLSELVEQKIHDAPPAIHSHRPDVSRGLEIVVRRALAREAINRFQDATEFAQALSNSGRTNCKLV